MSSIPPSGSSLPPLSKLSVYAVTWNLYGKYDIYAIGTEECERSIGKSVVFPSKERWEAKLMELMGGGYSVIGSHTLAAIHIMIFIRAALKPLVADVEVASVATGFVNLIGNKGGVGICFRVLETSFLFINSHFAAHEEKVNERNADYWRINTEMELSYDSSSTRPQFVTDRFDRVFWLGDLNYRLIMNRRMADALIADRMMEVLTGNDQLVLEMKAKRVFEGFQEGAITFMPTYKYDIDSDHYDSSELSRIPSWTDRILWKKSQAITLQKYNCVQELRVSDHRPVYAVFTVDVSAPMPRQRVLKSKLCSVM